MKVAIRVDASSAIGAGHLMRCLALAHALRGRNFAVMFICRALPESLSTRVRELGISLVEIGQPDEGDGKSSMPFPWLQDANRTVEAIGNEFIDLLVIDHYQIDENWERVVSPHAGRIMVIDDLANRKHVCDALLDQNYYHNYKSRYAGLVPEFCNMLLGPSFILLRSEFDKVITSGLRDHKALKPVTRIQLCFGGSDPTKETLKALRALRKLNHFYQIEVIAGAACAHLDDIRRFCVEWPGLELVVSADDMALRMANADVAIGAAGSMCWERATQGLPSIVISIAENQVQAARDLDDIGFHNYLGESANVTESMILDALQDLLDQPEKRLQYATVSQALVDARGCERTLNMLFPVNTSSGVTTC